MKLPEPPIGIGTTTLEYLYYRYPWLQTFVENKDKEIKKLKELTVAQEIYIKLLERKR